MSPSHHTQHGSRPADRPASVGDTIRETAQTAAGAVRDAADRARRSAGDAYESATDWASERYDQYGRRTSQGFRGARSSTEQFVSENPVLVGVIGLAAGLLLGSLLPRTRPEDRAFGHWADEVRDQGLRYARDVTQRGREFVEETLNDVAEAARSAGESEGAQGRQGQDAAAPGAAAPQGNLTGGNLTGGREGPSGRHQNV